MTYTLHCIVVGERTTFPITLDENKSVGELQAEITASQADLRAVPSRHLKLYRIKVPTFNESDEQKYIRDVEQISKNLNQLKELNTGWMIRRYFQKEEDRAPETIHVLVQLPSSE